MILRILAGLLALSPVAARAEWREARSDHFTVYADDSEAKVARFAERLERFDATLRMLTELPATPITPANRVTVYVVNDVGALSGSNSVAGFYVPRAGGSVAFVPARGGEGWGELGVEEVLFHEYTHHFMLTNYAEAAFPPWFVEGFAEFFATTRMLANGTIEVARPPVYRAYAFANGLPLPAQDLLTGDQKKLNSDAVYGEGWLLTHMLMLEPKRRAQFAGFMTAITKGESIAKAAEAMGDLNQLDRDMRRYIRSSIRYSIIPPGTIAPAMVKVRTLTPGEAATMKVRIRSKRGVDDRAAKALLPMAQRAAAPFPNDPAAQAALAEAEYDAGNYAAAEAAARRAVATDPKSIPGHIYIGMARMAAAQATKSTDVALWKSIRQSFLAANAIENDHPEPLILFYRSFGAAGQEPTANARDALLRAHALAPQDRDLRMQAAYVLLEQGKAPDARRVLGPVAFAPHGGDTATFAGELIAKIDTGGVKAALERWRQTPPDEKAKEKPKG